MGKEKVKKALLTGAGSMYLQTLKNEPDRKTKPIYGESVYETPSLEKVSASLELVEKTVRLSNVPHSEIAVVKKVEITVDAGYFPDGFAEEHSGMVKIGDGWSMPTNPTKKPFRYAQPFTDDKGNELIVNYPYCFLSPVDKDGETEKDDVNEKMQQFKITALPLPFLVTVDELTSAFVYHQIDLAVEENKSKYERDKLLEQGWYDVETLAACVK